MPLVNNISAPGTVNINPFDVTATANMNPEQIPWVNTYKSVVLHEVGHAWSATRVATDYTSDPVKIVEWCFTREALASLYAFNVLTELGITDGSMIVVGPPEGPVDIYAIMLASVQGTDPRSSSYEAKLLAAARGKFSRSPKYRTYCEGFAKKGGLPPGYFPPPTDDGSGSSPGGTVPMPPAYVPKIPGGYWQPVPNVSE